MARDPLIGQYCYKDPTEARFADEPSIERWLAKDGGRAMILLTEMGSGAMVGYGWTGPGTSEHAPDSETTFAMRLGEPARGKGLAKPFTRTILDASSILYGARGIWLEAWASNGPAVHSYEGVGFIATNVTDAVRETVDGEKIGDQRITMLLPNYRLPNTRLA